MDIWRCGVCSVVANRNRYRSRIDTEEISVGGILLPNTKACKYCHNNMGMPLSDTEVRVDELNLLVKINDNLHDVFVALSVG